MFIQYFNMFYNILKVQRASFIRLVCFVFLEKYLKNGFYLDIGASQSKVRSFLSAAVILSLIDFFPTPLLVRDLLQGVI